MIANGTEIRLHDPARRPPGWTDVIAPSQCALFLRDARTSAPCRADGTLSADPAEATCVIFDSIDDAERSARDYVARFPHLCADVFDAEGRANPPLITIAAGGGTDAGSSRTRRAIAAVLVAVALPLIWLDWSHDLSLIFPTFLGLSCIVAAVRLLHWDVGARSRERTRQHRLDAYRRNRSDA